MSAPAWQACLARHLTHAAWVERLDEELGIRHGLDWGDFVLLNALDGDGDGEAGSLMALARELHCPASQLLRRLRPLEKTGLLARHTGETGPLRVMLRPVGRRLLGEAQDTVQAVCADLQRESACT